MSQSSAVFGKERWAGSRTGEAASTGSQSALFQAVRRPRWVSWIITAAAVLVAVVGQPRQPRHDLVLVGEQIAEAGGRVRRHDAEPAVMVSAMPPFAFST